MTSVGHVMLPGATDAKRVRSSTSRLRAVRLSLSGALLGIAMVGALALVFGFQDQAYLDFIGALVGLVFAALAVRTMHIV